MKLTNDLQEVKPTFFCSVPRLYNKIYDKMKGNIEALTGMKKILANKAIKTKLENLENHA